MRIGYLSPLALALLAGISLPAQASSDDSCYPDWRVSRDTLDPCNNLPFLSPGNDSRANLRLLLADKKAAPLTPNALSEDDLAEGFGPVPFPVYRLVPRGEAEPVTSDAPETSPLDALLEPLGIKREATKAAGDAFLNGEGSRCRSNDENSAAAFIRQVIKADMPAAERDLLVKARLQLLTACEWVGPVVEPPQDIQSSEGQLFRTYLQAAADFYTGRFTDAGPGFVATQNAASPWLKETALYMTARNALNQAQANTYDEDGVPHLDRVDKPALAEAEKGFDAYLKSYPQGDYSASARGLLRRVYWLADDNEKLAEAFAWQLTQATNEQRNVSVDELVEEADLKLLMVNSDTVRTPMIQLVSDLMVMRGGNQPALSRADLEKQKAAFADEPAFYDYLLAVSALYVEHQPDAALKQLPHSVPSSLNYFAFSQQTLRALALEAKQDWKGAQDLWLQLLPLANLPLQRDQLELALALNHERSGQLAKVFAADSPISAKQVRYILLRNVAGPDLLRQQIAKADDPVERRVCWAHALSAGCRDASSMVQCRR